MDKKNYIITVFTPAYNRADTLRNLYSSLLQQTCRDFKWLIVDDGSNDETRELVRDFIDSKEFPIQYQYQENKGKHAAHNLGVQLTETELFFCVDSDDLLTTDAISFLLESWKLLDEDYKEKLSGMVAYRGNFDGIIIGTEFPSNLLYAPLSEIYRLGKKGDTALIFRTDILKKYLFPVFSGEKFIRESLVYEQIDRQYSLHILNKVIYLCEYRQDGLTFNTYKLEQSSPKGAALYRYKEYQKGTGLIAKINLLTAYVYFSIKGKSKKEAIAKIGTLRFIFILPFSLLYGLRIQFIIKKKEKNETAK